VFEIRDFVSVEGNSMTKASQKSTQAARFAGPWRWARKNGPSVIETQTQRGFRCRCSTIRRRVEFLWPGLVYAGTKVDAAFLTEMGWADQ